MNYVTKKEFEKLAEEQYSSCVSFYLPTHRGGMEVINEQDRLVFKNQLKAVSEDFAKRGWEENNIATFLQPAKELMENPLFWRKQKEGLAIFLSSNSLKYYNLPFEVEPYFHIAREYYLRPLVPVFSGEGEFYVLGLNLHHISFYDGNREELKEVYVEDFTPQRMEEVVGYDYKEKFLQFRSQQEGHGQASFHGHGEWKGEFKKDEILRFFQEIDKKIVQFIGGKNIPLFVVGQGYLFSIYQKVNSYPHLLDEYLDLNPDHINISDLHEKIWNKLYHRFDQDRAKKVGLIQQFHNTPRTSFDLSEIIPAAIQGKVDTLFVQKGTEIWGIYDKSNDSIIVEEEQSDSNVSLLNLAIVEVLRNGGNVYEQIAETMPMPYVVKRIVVLIVFYRYSFSKNQLLVTNVKTTEFANV
jgi:hypothetical protein